MSHYLESELKTTDDFFVQKGSRLLQEEEASEEWYADWIKEVATHQIYAKCLLPSTLTNGKSKFSLSAIASLAERLGYYSPAHGYSFQVSLLGIIPHLRSKNEEQRKKAAAALLSGGLFAFGLSEKEQGSDIYASETFLKNRLLNGKKYYIGNANCADRIAILAKDASVSDQRSLESFVFASISPAEHPQCFKKGDKIKTMGVRSAHVGQFELVDFPASDDAVLSRGKEAWDSVFGTVNIGKFVLGFGAIGMLKHSFSEAWEHANRRRLFNQRVTDFPQIKALFSSANSRLIGMQLFANRALDYANVVSSSERRFLLYSSVQKSLVSLQGVRAMAELSEAIGAKGFERTTYFESAIRNSYLLPSLEGSTHINYGIAMQFFRKMMLEPTEKRLTFDQAEIPSEPLRLLDMSTGKLKDIPFHSIAGSLESLASSLNETLPSLDVFCTQAKRLKWASLSLGALHKPKDHPELFLEWGKLLSTLAYAQLIAEEAERSRLPAFQIEGVFGMLREELNQRILGCLAIPGQKLALRIATNRTFFVRTRDAKSEKLILESIAEKNGKFDFRVLGRA